MDRQLLTVDEQMDKIEKSIDAISAKLDLAIKSESFKGKIFILLTCAIGVIIAIFMILALNSPTL